MRTPIHAALAAVVLPVMGLAWSTLAGAQVYPNRPIRFVVPYATGGLTDVTTRALAKKMSDNLGVPTVVDNRPGGAAIPGTEHGAKSAPDGYTITNSDPGPLAINPALYSKLPYDPLKDFAPVSTASSTPLFLAVNASLPARSIRELIDHAKANPGLNFGSIGNGSVHHLALEMFKQLAGVNLVHIPYKGVAQAVPALVTGDVAMVISAYSTLKPHVDGGKVRVLAAVNQRSTVLPEVPTIAEAGLAGFDIKPKSGFLVPAATPRPVVEKLNAAMRAALSEPDLVQQLAALSIVAESSTPEQYAEIIRKDYDLYGRLIRTAGVKID